MKIRKLLWTITVISIIVLGNGLTTKAIPNQISDDISPDLFHIGTVYLNINVSASEFTPAEFTVKESTTVNLTIESVDIGHSFEILEYGINETIIANSTVNIEFVADTLGTFEYLSVNCSTTGTMTVEDPYVPDLPRPEDITIMFDLSHNSNATEIALKYSGIANWTTDNNFQLIVNENNFLVVDTLRYIDVLMILEPDEDFTESEIDVVKIFIENGRSMFLTGSEATAFTNINNFTKPFGFQFDNTTARFINATLPATDGENNTLSSFISTNFLDHPIINENQYVPLTDEIITKIKYTGTLLEYNATWITGFTEESNLTDSDELIDSYSLFYGNNSIYADANGDTIYWENETAGINNTLIAAVETSFGSRILSIGSAEILNNTMVGRYEFNEIFFQRALQWVAKMYAVLRNDDYYVGAYDAKIGELINTSVSYYAQNNSVLDDINVTLRIWRASQISDSFYMTQINNSYYEGVINTTNLKKGFVSVNIVAHKRGYGFNITEEIFLEINPGEAVPYDVPILYIITFVLTIGIGVLALAFIFIRVIRAPKTEDAAEDIEEEETESDEEIDLDEYETEEETESDET
ncbi:MAG: cupredoxin domain-containing protein [Candidatus Heimdallarchaeota archaeon]|nr:cupredoxin domain-containing protein [Candidatus Heimdallarchaeota archaeon]MCK4289696.1 cupredoxin domain-containing protein [Candidatus Heimdallarchaeota archaeon]